MHPFRFRLLSGSALLLVLAAPADALLAERVTTVSLTLPAALEAARPGWHMLSMRTMGPRLYHAPLDDGRTLVGWTDATLTGHVSVVSGATIQTTFDFAARPVRGLVAHAGGAFGVLLWDQGGAGVADDVMRLSRRNADGSEVWTVAVSTAELVPNPTSGVYIGDSRLAHGGGIYGAYFSVHGLSGVFAGHDGDHYQRVTDAGVLTTGGWPWGPSHSMAQLIAHHPDNGTFGAFAITDCFPSKALVFNNTVQNTFVLGADCIGHTTGQLGQMAAAANALWLVAFNAIDTTGSPGKGVGVARVRVGQPPSVAWLTNTTGYDERDPSLARIGASLASNRFLAGWRLQSDGSARIAVIDSFGAVLEGPELVSPAVNWGTRDDSYRSRPDGSVSWVEGNAGSTTLKLHRYAEATVAVEPPSSAGGLRLYGATPNPAPGGMTRVAFRLGSSARVTLRIVDPAGRRVRTLDGAWSAGAHEIAWDGRDDRGQPVRSGLYLATLEAGRDRATTKLLVLAR